MLAIIGRVDQVLKFWIVIDLKSTYFAFVNSDIDWLDFHQQLCCHVWVTETGLDVVTRALDKLKVTINTVVFYINAPFYIRLYLHFYLENVRLLDYLFDSPSILLLFCPCDLNIFIQPIINFF